MRRYGRSGENGFYLGHEHAGGQCPVFQTLHAQQVAYSAHAHTIRALVVAEKTKGVRQS